MAFAPSLGGAFLFGEGIHGWHDPETGRYMDGLWFYDVAGHRWVNMHPGTDVRNPPVLSVDDAGFEVDQNGSMAPIASMVHGYQMYTWDPVRELLFAVTSGHNYYKEVLPSVARFRLTNLRRLNYTHASPWIFDPRNRSWSRKRTRFPGPRIEHGSVLIHAAASGNLLFLTGSQSAVYDPEANAWKTLSPLGPRPPFGIDAVACHDPRRNRVYFGGGAYPVATGGNALWIYDVRKNRWIDPKPAGDPGGAHYGTNVAMLHCDTAADVVVLVRHQGPRRGVYVYHPERNAWSAQPSPLPREWPEGTTAGGSSGFYDPGRNLHFFHVAGDSQDNGRILIYRYQE